jgi:rubrerythrin
VHEFFKGKEIVMASLKGSKTENNLKEAFAGESQANSRYLYFAQKADVEGYNDVSAVFRSTAEGETGHAHGHLNSWNRSAIPPPASRSARRTKSGFAIAGETHEYTDMYPAWRARRVRKASRDRGLVRDSRQSREEPRRPLPEGTRQPREVST